MKRTILDYAIAIMLMHAGTVSAGGLWLNEFGDFSSGRAAAGAAAGVDEAMTIAYNPASISRLDGSQLFASAGAIVGQMNFDVQYTSPRHGTQDGGNAGEVAPIASMAYVNDLDSEKWSAGIALGALSGAGMDYGDDWVGRYQATKVSLVLMALSPTLAYQVTNELSLGASVQALYSNLELDFALPRPDPLKPDGSGSIDGDDVKPAFSLGAMYEPSDSTRFGLFYQSEVKVKFDGDLKVNYSDFNVGDNIELARSVATDTELTQGEYVRFGVHQDMNERWGVDFTVGWDNWSALSNVLVSTQGGSAGIPTRWKDTYHYAWGTQYKLDEYWDLTAGIAYDTNPVSSQNRNAQLPVDKQIRYAAGARYKLSDSLTVGGYVNYMDLGSAQITSDRFGGKFDYNNATQLVANMTWRF